MPATVAAGGVQTPRPKPASGFLFGLVADPEGRLGRHTGAAASPCRPPATSEKGDVGCFCGGDGAGGPPAAPPPAGDSGVIGDSPPPSIALGSKGNPPSLSPAPEGTAPASPSAKKAEALRRFVPAEGVSGGLLLAPAAPLLEAAAPAGCCCAAFVDPLRLAGTPDANPGAIMPPPPPVAAVRKEEKESALRRRRRRAPALAAETRPSPGEREDGETVLVPPLPPLLLRDDAGDEAAGEAECGGDSAGTTELRFVEESRLGFVGVCIPAPPPPYACAAGEEDAEGGQSRPVLAECGTPPP